jgi:hypothetical protein
MMMEAAGSLATFALYKLGCMTLCQKNILYILIIFVILLILSNKLLG